MEAPSKQSIEVCCFTLGLRAVGGIMYLDTDGNPPLDVDADSCPMKVQINLEQQQHSHIDDEKQYRKMFFDGIKKETTAKEFQMMVSELGPTEQVWMAVSKETKLSRGFGFAIFRHTKSMEKLLGKNRQAKYIQFSSGEMLEIKRAIPKVG